ncbi:hypothetical protein C791_0564 [Amycolatopsis azurea DSM 43854]|uniref:Uncharacterized protein n=1 Tax=Amycolatopsis azurea DSM 43854 TaxID=1238180 RepID=M2NIR3_9PSEU|nr:hypothetical protein C791_0564 [Amycolatopsis azurea DSM 43854]
MGAVPLVVVPLSVGLVGLPPSLPVWWPGDGSDRGVGEPPPSPPCVRGELPPSPVWLGEPPLSARVCGAGDPASGVWLGEPPVSARVCGAGDPASGVWLGEPPLSARVCGAGEPPSGVWLGEPPVSARFGVGEPPSGVRCGVPESPGEPPSDRVCGAGVSERAALGEPPPPSGVPPEPLSEVDGPSPSPVRPGEPPSERVCEPPPSLVDDEPPPSPPRVVLDGESPPESPWRDPPESPFEPESPEPSPERPESPEPPESPSEPFEPLEPSPELFEPSPEPLPDPSPEPSPEPLPEPSPSGPSPDPEPAPPPSGPPDPPRPPRWTKPPVLMFRVLITSRPVTLPAILPKILMIFSKTSASLPSSGETRRIASQSSLSLSAILAAHSAIAVTACATTTGVPKPRENTVSMTQEMSLPTASAISWRMNSRTNETISPKIITTVLIAPATVAAPLIASACSAACLRYWSAASPVQPVVPFLTAFENSTWVSSSFLATLPQVSEYDWMTGGSPATASSMSFSGCMCSIRNDATDDIR